jgi:hypothetical protein
VDGTAFIDFTAADVLTGKTGNLLVVRDSSGRAIQGFIKAAGTGETYNDLVTSWNNWVSAFSTFTSSGTTITSAIDDGDPDAYAKSNTLTLAAGALFKSVSSITLNSGTAPTYYIGYNTPRSYQGVLGNATIYRSNVTAFAGGANDVVLFVASVATNFSATISLQQVLTPSATGVTIVSTKGGATFNWAQKNASFNYNDPSGYTYQIYKVLDAPVVDSDACANANATINLTAGSAAWSCTGINDSAYQDGKHIIAVYDTAGVAAFGYYKASGSGAVVNTKGGSTQNWISIGTGFSTAGNYTRKVLYVGD